MSTIHEYSDVTVGSGFGFGPAQGCFLLPEGGSELLVQAAGRWLGEDAWPAHHHLQNHPRGAERAAGSGGATTRATDEAARDGEAAHEFGEGGAAVEEAAAIAAPSHGGRFDEEAVRAARRDVAPVARRNALAGAGAGAGVVGASDSQLYTGWPSGSSSHAASAHRLCARSDCSRPTLSFCPASPSLRSAAASLPCP